MCSGWDSRFANILGIIWIKYIKDYLPISTKTVRIIVSCHRFIPVSSYATQLLYHNLYEF